MSRIADEATFTKELQLVEQRYEQITGRKMEKYYRPPQGVYSEENLKMAQKLGYRTVFWSLAYVDWYQDQQPTADEAYDKLLGRIHPGAIVLLHSTSTTNAAILDTLLTKWEQMGYRFGTLPELFEKYSAPHGGSLSSSWQTSLSLMSSSPSAQSLIIAMYMGSFITLAARHCELSLRQSSSPVIRFL